MHDGGQVVVRGSNGQKSCITGESCGWCTTDLRAIIVDDALQDEQSFLQRSSAKQDSKGKRAPSVPKSPVCDGEAPAEIEDAKMGRYLRVRRHE